LDKAIQYVREHPDVAAVTGELVELPEASGPDDKPPLVDRVDCSASEVAHSGGAALYRRSVLEEVGSFNPFLYSDEEPDLCIRIRCAGYQVVQLHHPVAYHYSDPGNRLSTQIERWRRNLFLGAGQNIRYHLGSDILWPYLWERGYGVLPVLGLATGAVSLLWALASGQWLWFALWAALLGMLVGIDAFRKHSLHQAVFSLLLRILIADGTIRGFLLRPVPPSSYPGSYERIRRPDSVPFGGNQGMKRGE
jgi:hypothetical protein